jgi:hypothetical protein
MIEFDKYQREVIEVSLTNKYKKVVVLKDDIVNDDNMYVAISRAIEELYIY